MFHTNRLMGLGGSSVLACLLLCILPSITSAQFFNPKKLSYWLKPGDNILVSEDSATIANYFSISFEDSLSKKTFKKLAEGKSGTLVMVLETLDSTTENALAGFGRIQIFRDRISVSGSNIPLSTTIKGDPAIVRISYNYSTGNRNFSSIYFVDSLTRFTEILQFGDNLDTMEIRKVESYLALKYSINITQNKNKKLRDYIDGDDEKFWDIKRDKIFDEEVMALGRVDSLGFYQTQTYSADSKKLKISLDTITCLGMMPDIELSNNSMVILAKSQTTPERLECGQTPGSRAWKIKLVDWDYSINEFYLTMDKELDEEEFPSLTNGFTHTSLDGKISNKQTRLTVPVFPEMEKNDYFLTWDNSKTECTPLCNLQAIPCTPASTSFININIADEALPAHLDILNLNTNEKLEQDITANFSTVKNLISGQYQITVSNGNFQLADRVLLLDNCPPITEKSTTVASHLQALDNTSGFSSQGAMTLSATDNDKSMYLQEKKITAGITAFPNPNTTNHKISFQFNQLDDTPFLIEIFDKGGAPLFSQKFTPTQWEGVFNHTFDVDGTYLVRFSSPVYADLIQVVVN